MEMSGIPPQEALDLYYDILSANEEDQELKVPESLRPFAEQLVQGVYLHQSEIDQLISSASEHWRLERMSLVDRNVLRIALYEMLHCPEIPPKVSINEAVDLGKSFGSADSGAFINGILDRILAELQQQGKIPSPPPPEA
jgi:N utilization substance protein B